MERIEKQRRLDIADKNMTASVGLMGGFFFLRAVYYCALVNLRDCGAAELIFCAILPMLLAAAFFVLLRGVHLTRPEVYGVLGAALCLFLAGWSVTLDGTVHRVFGCLLSVLAAAGLAVRTLGLPGSRWYACGPLLAGLAYRVCAYDLTHLSRMKEPAFLVMEGSVWCLLGSLYALAWSLGAPSAKEKAAETRKGKRA